MEQTVSATTNGLLTLCDTHCHIHDDDYPLPADEVLINAVGAGVSKLLTMGSCLVSDCQAIVYAKGYDGTSGVTVRVGIGLYPHDVPAGGLTDETMVELTGMIRDNPQLVAGIGEIGLDYYYDTVSRELQIDTLERMIQLAVDCDLSMSFHVRSGQYGDAFADFWSIIRNFPDVKGVLHSFTDNMANLEKALNAGLYVGVNGIFTFNKDAELGKVYDHMPLERIVLETDAPYLAPVPYRGKVNQPAYIRQIAECLAKHYNMEVAEIARITTANAVTVYPALA